MSINDKDPENLPPEDESALPEMITPSGASLAAENAIDSEEMSGLESLFENREFLQNVLANQYNTDSVLQRRVAVDMLLHQRYFFLYIYDKGIPPDEVPGKFVRKFYTESGLLVYVMTHCLILTAGDKAFETYGNWGRVISSIHELFESNTEIREWANVGLWASDLILEADAWALGMLYDLAVGKEPPSELASNKLALLQNVLGEKARKFSKKKAGPGAPMPVGPGSVTPGVGR